MAGCTLLVTAHPDDEAMFFSPTILHLIEQGLRVALLCLSTGNADGLGKLRSQELMHACSLLGISRQDVLLVDDTRLQDGMQQQWAAAAVAEHVAQAVQRFAPDKVVTFDAHGVSGHPNHLATHAGVLHWWGGAQSRSTSSSSGQSNLPQLWQLETVALPRKYLALMDAPLSWLLAAQRRDGLQISLQPRRAWAALLAHGSQMVWYRRAWLLLSRYMYVNTLARRL